jgi:uncharacterized protein (DUF2252 family)
MKMQMPRPAGRLKPLIERRRRKMAESAHAYVRGNTLKFYEWLDSSDAAKRLPEGPAIWICGDCHVGNLGPIASSDGRVDIQIRDLDQTVIGNPAHDIIRLSLSFAMAARSSDLPGLTTALIIEQIIDGYSAALKTKTKVLDAAKEIEPVRKVMREALRRKWRHLAEERIEDVTPRIPLGKRFWALSQAEQREIARIFAEPATRKLITGLKSRDDKDKVAVLDAAYWIKGCSSLGRLRYAVLLGVGSGKRRELCLADIKESTKAAAPRSKKMPVPTNNAERVVAGARALSPFLGNRMLPVHFLEKPAVLRELMPQDLKFEMERLTQLEAIAAAKLLAGVVGRAHGRQMSSDVSVAWAKELNRKQSKTLDAPSWLWSSVVDLVAIHESAYLEHCRAFALGG